MADQWVEFFENRTGNVRCCSLFPLLFPKSIKIHNLLILNDHKTNRRFEPCSAHHAAFF